MKGSATASRNSIWLGSVCQWCNKPLVAPAKVSRDKSGPVVTGQYPWTHTRTGEEACNPEDLLRKF